MDERQQAQVAYRETITNKAESASPVHPADRRKGMFGDVSLTIDPLEPGSGFPLRERRIVGGSIPKNASGRRGRGIEGGREERCHAALPDVDIRFR